MTSTLGDVTTATFTLNSFESNPIRLGQRGVLEGIEIRNYQGAKITFKVAIDSEDIFLPLYDADGIRVTSIACPNCFITFSSHVTRGVNWIKLVRDKLGTEESIELVIRYE